MIRRFHAEPRLGIVGGFIYERVSGEWRSRKANSQDSVAGAIQLFRRSVYQHIGGYVPLHLGGEDWLAMLKARMAGWAVVAMPEFRVFHYRATSTAGGRWRGLFRLGMMDASFGSHPLFELFKCGRRVMAPPMLLGSVLRMAGFVWWIISGRKPLLSPDQVAFLRKEQMSKIRRQARAGANKPMVASKGISA
jgi:poly-beta-1,6-N-acetyl-D-glucosamine synthase